MMANVAQLVEPRFVVPVVVGSSPCLPDKNNAPFTGALFLSGANDGARTHDNRYHKPGLYQLSYIRH